MQDTLHQFAIWSPEVRANPHPVYAQMRAESPVYPALGPVTGERFWFLTRYEDCVATLKDHEHFANDFTKHLTPEQVERIAPPGDAVTLLTRHMLNFDPPDQTRLRTLVHKAFTPRMVDNLQTLVEQTADQLLNSLQDVKSFDLIDEFAFPLPVIVIAGLLGIPPEERDQFRRWTQTVIFEFDDMEARGIAAMQMIAYFNEVIEKRRASPQDDLISALVAAHEADDKLDHQELLCMIFLLLAAGHETTVNLIGTGTFNLLRSPDQLRKLRENPALIKSAVEEMLRYDGSAETTFTRYTTQDVVVGGIHIPAGERVMPVILAANRDPEVFDNPDRFDVARDPNRHIAFGVGIHYCVGSPLARLETATAINALLRRMPTIELAVRQDEVQWKSRGIGFRGLEHLPLAYS